MLLKILFLVVKQITFVEWSTGTLFLSVVLGQVASASAGSILKCRVSGPSQCY